MRLSFFEGVSAGKKLLATVIGVVAVTAAIWLTTGSRVAVDDVDALVSPSSDSSTILADGEAASTPAELSTMLDAISHERAAPGMDAASAESRLEEQQRRDKVRKGVLAGDATVLDDAKRLAILSSLCVGYMSMLSHPPRDNEEYKFLRNFLGEHCGGWDLTVRTSESGGIILGDPLLRVEEFIGLLDAQYLSAQELLHRDLGSRGDSEERRKQLIDLILETDYIFTLSVALQSFATNGEGTFDGRMRLEYIENLPRMGNGFDFRSSRFLELVAVQVGCLGALVDCGPNSLFAIQLCMSRGTCRNGVSVQDYLLDQYSARDILASRIAAQRIVDARASRARAGVN